LQVSEYHVCKRLLYTTVGDSNEKVWDIFLLLPSFIFLVLLGYSSPRTRQQLAKVSILPRTLHLLILTATAAAFLRSLLLLALPTQPHSDGIKDKVAWTICRSIGFSLDLCCLLSLAIPSPSSFSPPCSPGSSFSPPAFGSSPGSEAATRHPTKRYLHLLAASAFVWGIFTLVLELASPSKEFQVFSTCNSLYGEGGGLFTSLTALLLSFLYSAVLLIRLLSPLNQHIGSVLLFLLLGLLIHLVRALGGLLLYQDVPAGICLTALTLFIQVTCLPPFAWFCLLRPLLGIGLLGRGGGYRPQVDGEWIEDDNEEEHWRDLDSSPHTTSID